jgi:anthranilate synthase component 2
MRVLLVDNYDSFTHNVAQLIGALGHEPVVLRNDHPALDDIATLAPARIILSPGPGDPRDPGYFGRCARILREVSPTVPTLGICLGHQGLGHVYGAHVVRWRPRHGKVSPVRHDAQGLFRGLPNPMPAMRYHALALDPETLPACLQVTARALDDDAVMAVAHTSLPIWGVQFHPESIGTPDGAALLTNFLGP